LDSFHHYANPHVKTHEAWVYGADRAQGLPRARGPYASTPVEGYVVSLVAFYERGFGTPQHQFLHSLLWYYGLKHHHLAPSGVLHIAAFLTLCEAYLGIDPELHLWKYFFYLRCLQDPKAELMIFGVVVIHVKMGHGVDPYHEIPHAHIDEAVVEEVILPEERCFHSAP
jgi:hypothetical protein